MINWLLWVRRVENRKYFSYHGESSPVFAGFFSWWSLNCGNAQGCWTLISAINQSMVLKAPMSWAGSLYRPFTQELNSNDPCGFLPPQNTLWFLHLCFEVLRAVFSEIGDLSCSVNENEPWWQICSIILLQ